MCCSKSAAVSVCGSDVHQAHNTHSWPVNVPVVLGHEFGGTVARAGRSVRGFREGDRVVSETAAQICGECMQCRSGLVQPLPDAARVRLWARRRDGAVRARAGAVPAPHSRLAAVRPRLPGRAARRRLSGDVRELDDPSRRLGRRARARADRAAVRADGGAVGRRSADRRRADRRCPAARDGARARRDAHREHAGAEPRRTRPRPAARRRRRRLRRHRREPSAGGRDQAGAPERTGHQGRLVARQARRRHEPAGAAQRAHPGIVQPQLPGLGAGHPPARPPPHACPKPSSACARRSTAGSEAFDAMHDRRVIKSVLLPNGH